MKPTLYILCGPPGSGKSTWAYNLMKKDENIRYVSRDEIRFALVKAEEEYFAHEDQVFKKFVNTICQTLIDGFDVIADATHINKASRNKLIHAIDAQYTNYDIIYVVFCADINICLTRNAQREGRARVPEVAIHNMCNAFQIPSTSEDPRIEDIILIK